MIYLLFHPMQDLGPRYHLSFAFLSVAQSSTLQALFHGLLAFISVSRFLQASMLRCDLSRNSGINDFGVASNFLTLFFDLSKIGVYINDLTIYNSTKNTEKYYSDARA